MSDLVVNIRQISNYPNIGASNGTETLLLQQGGLGGPYASMTTETLVATALQGSAAPPFGVGAVPPADAGGAQIFTDNFAMAKPGGLAFNCYWDGVEVASWQPGFTGLIKQHPDLGAFEWYLGNGVPGQLATLQVVMSLSMAGSLSLPFGTLTVARDPAAAFEVATMGWVANNSVHSFNNRKGQVQLTAADVYAALQLCDPLATQPWVISAIQAGIQNLLVTCPFVNTWNGRKGQVYLTLADITCVFYQPGQQPISPTPPITSNDDSIATTKWVGEYIANEFAGGGGNLATQSWVLANTVNSFNGRMGVVTLTTADVIDVGAAPLNSPNFSGVPTAPTAAVGQATGQIATTAFVQQAISANTAGVSTFNTRSGDVTLTAADVTAAGGLTNPSPNLTGSPSAPTAAPGTSTPQIANTQFVMTALAGTVQSFNTRTGAVVLTTADITGAGGAPLVSPNFSSVPTAPTAAPGTNTVQLATCAFVTAALNTAGGVSSFNGRTGAVDLIGNDISAAGGLVNPSVTLTGTPTAPTAPANTNSQQIATTAFVATAMSAGTVTSFNSRTGAVTLTGADISTAGGALLAGPAFTGAPTAPTATAGTNNTQLATTQFVMSAIAADTTGVTSFNTRTGAVSLTLADITAAGGAPSANPQFTGVPQGPTATAGTSTTQLATTQFVQSAIASSGVASFNGRTGAVTLIANDISAAQGALLASPTFTGTPMAPTATAGTNTTQLATTAYVMAAIRQPATVAPLMDGTAAVGTSLLYARQDHVHPSDTTKASLSGATFTGTITATGTASVTSASTSFVILDGSTVNERGIVARLNGSNRWVLDLCNGAAESGGNVGNDFQLNAYDNTGAFSGDPLLIQRSNGYVNINPHASFGGQGSQLTLCGQNGSYRSILFQSGPYNIASGQRWIMYTDSTGEASGNAGSNFGINCLDNTGGYIDTPMRITRSSAVVTFSQPIVNGSDLRLKRAIEPIAGALEKVRAMQGITYCEAKSDADGRRHLGMVAQDVAKILPEAVYESPDPGPNGRGSNATLLGIAYPNLVAVLVEAIKELTARVMLLEAAAA